MSETSITDQFAIVLANAAFQRVVVSIQMSRGQPQIPDHPYTVQLRRRLHQPGQHKLEEGLVIDHPEPEALPRAADHINQQHRGRPLDHRASCGRDALIITPEIEAVLASVQLADPDLHQRHEFSLTTGRAEMLHNATLAMPLLHDLDRGRSRPGPHFPQIRTHPPILTSPLVPQNHPFQSPDKHKHSHTTNSCGTQA